MTIMNSRHQIINAWAQKMSLCHSNFNKIVISTSRPYNVTVQGRAAHSLRSDQNHLMYSNPLPSPKWKEDWSMKGFLWVWRLGLVLTICWCRYIHIAHPTTSQNRWILLFAYSKLFRVQLAYYISVVFRSRHHISICLAELLWGR